MSAEHTTWLLRELYQEESPQHDPSPEESAFTPSPQDLEALAQMQEVLAQIRPVLTTAPALPDAIRQGIFEAAHREAATLSRRASRRAGPAAAPARKSRLQGVFAVAATVACVLGAGYFMTMSQPGESRFNEAAIPVSDEVAFGGEPSGEPPVALAAPQEPADAQTEGAGGSGGEGGGGGAKQELALNDELTGSAYEQRQYRDDPQAPPAPSSVPAQGDQIIPKSRAYDRGRGYESKKERPQPARRAVTKRDSPNTSADSLGASDLFDDESRAKDKSARNSFGGQEDVSGPSKKSPLPAAKPKLSAKGELPYLSETEEKAKKPGDTPAPMAAAPSAETVTLPSLQEAERAWKSENYSRTLERSDQYIKSGQGSPTERARALELKAKALKALGRGSEATAVLKTLQEDYPNYYEKENVRKKKAKSPSSQDRMETELKEPTKAF